MHAKFRKDTAGASVPATPDAPANSGLPAAFGAALANAVAVPKGAGPAGGATSARPDQVNKAPKPLTAVNRTMSPRHGHR